MLERNLMRLYEQFHAPAHHYPTMKAANENNSSSNNNETGNSSVWSFRLQAYSAAVLTAILAMQLLKKA